MVKDSLVVLEQQLEGMAVAGHLLLVEAPRPLLLQAMVVLVRIPQFLVRPLGMQAVVEGRTLLVREEPRRMAGVLVVSVPQERLVQQIQAAAVAVDMLLLVFLEVPALSSSVIRIAILLLPPRQVRQQSL